MSSSLPNDNASNTNTFYTAESPRQANNANLEEIVTPRGNKKNNVKPIKLNFSKEVVTTNATQPALPPMEIPSDLYKELPMKLVANPIFIDFMYSNVVISAKHIYDYYLKHSAELPREIGKMIRFHYEDITIVGGAVVTLLDHMLKGYKERHQLSALNTVFQKGTSDIDMTWSMPAIPTTPSQYPEHLMFVGNKMVEILQLAFNHPHFMNEVKKIIQSILKKNCRFSAKVSSHDQSVKYGSFSITFTFIVDDQPIKIGDLTLHDAFNSQKYNDFHQVISQPKTRPMIEDPIYCINPIASQMYGTEINTIVLDPFTPNSVPIRIPTLSRFVRQQLFAAGNLLLDEAYKPELKEKGFNLFRRVVYILYLLHAYHKNTNTTNLRKIGILAHPYSSKLLLFNMVLQKMQLILSLQRNDTAKTAFIEQLKNIFTISPNLYQTLIEQLNEMIEKEKVAQQANMLRQQMLGYQAPQYRYQQPIRSVPTSGHTSFPSVLPPKGPPRKKGGQTRRQTRRTRSQKND